MYFVQCVEYGVPVGMDIHEQIRIAPSHETGQKGGGKRIKPDLE